MRCSTSGQVDVRPEYDARSGVGPELCAECHTQWYALRMTRDGRNDVQLAVRVPNELVSELDALVPQVHSTRAEAVRAAVEACLYRLNCERDAQRYADTPLDNAELALAVDPDGWTATPLW